MPEEIPERHQNHGQNQEVMSQTIFFIQAPPLTVAKKQ